METREKVLEAMRSAGEVVTVSGLERKEVDKVFKQLKKEEAIVSPVRCKWEIAE